MAAVEEEDPERVRAALILSSFQDRELKRCPEWAPTQPSGEASSAGAVAAGVPLRSRRPERLSMQSGETSLAGTVAARVPESWPKAKRSGSRGETSKEREMGHAAVAKGSGAPRSSEQERCSEMPAATAQRHPVAAALCNDAVAESGTGPSTSVASAKDPMMSPSPNTPLDYDADGSGAPSSSDGAAPARPQLKRKGTGGSGCVGDDDEGCSSPAKKRGLLDEEEKPMPILVELQRLSQTRASSGKGAPRPFDLNLLPCTLDEDDDGCPNTTCAL